MLLKDKTAVIYGGAGAIGSAVAQAFAEEGARVFLAGRSLANIKAVAAQVMASGGLADYRQLDALDKNQVERLTEDVVRKAGRVDISFNAIGIEDVQGVPLGKMNYEDFIKPVATAMQSHFVTATSAFRQMQKQISGGVILAITANAGRQPYEDVGGFGVACAAIEGLCRQLAVEGGRFGVRVVCLRSAGSPDAPGVNEVFNKHAANTGISRAEFESLMAEGNMLKRLPLLREIAGAAVLMASDKASAMTATIANLTCGEIAD